MLPLPKFSAYGLIEYTLFASGIALGFALFREPMNQVENLIANLRR